MHLLCWLSLCPQGMLHLGGCSLPVLLCLGSAVLWLLKMTMWWRSPHLLEREEERTQALQREGGEESWSDKYKAHFVDFTYKKSYVLNVLVNPNLRVFQSVNENIHTYCKWCHPLLYFHHRSGRHLPVPVNWGADGKSWGAEEWSHQEDSNSVDDDLDY